MLASGPEAGPVHGANDHGRHRLAAEHVAEFRRLIEDLVEQTPMKSTNISSATGLRPVAAAPAAAPTKAISAMACRARGRARTAA